MTIPIRNLYYLFCYAWERYPEGAATEVGIDECPDLPNLFGRVLINGSNRLLRRGLDRGYVTLEEERTSPRGRILLDRTIKEQTLYRGAVYCLVDELRRDVLHNQIIKSAANVLVRNAKLERSLAHELRLFCRKLPDVSDIRLTPDLFRRVQLSRHSRQYATLMSLCEFICRSELPEEAGQGSRFADIQRDEERMSRVFEDFLRNFYAHEQSAFAVAREDMRWRMDLSPGGDPTLVPIMRTDVTLRSSASTIVLDAKFYAEPFQRSVGAPKFRSAHLYQLFAYMKHASDRAAGLPVMGALVYAAPAGPSLNRYRMDGHEIAIATIDLSQPWPTVHHDLLDVLRSLQPDIHDAAPRATSDAAVVARH